MKSIPTIHNKVHLIGFISIALGMIYSKALMSIGVMTLILNLLIIADFKNYYNKLKHSKPFIYLLSFFIIYLLSFIWSDDLKYALHDFKIKLPFLALIVIGIVHPLKLKEIHFIFGILLIALLSSSVINFGLYHNWWNENKYEDIRQMSHFGSHIRYGILISLAVGICLYLIPHYKKLTFPLIMLILWFSFYTYISQVLSGTIALLIIFSFYFLNILRKKNSLLFGLFSVTLVTFFIGIIYYLIPSNNKTINLNNLPKYTKEGNLYTNDPMIRYDQSSFYFTICDVEIKREWEKNSQIKYEAKDKKTQEIRYTILRYLDSKELSKDAEGIRRLDKEDISNIENGIASITELETGLVARLHSLKYQLENYKNPNGHSFLQRLVYWENGWEIIKSNWIFGVGAGDNQLVFDEQYDKVNSILYPENRLRAHNQFLTILISLGIIGFVPFILFFISLIKTYYKEKSLFGIIILSVIIVTSLFEDTLETQLGVIYSGYFISLILSYNSKEIS